MVEAVGDEAGERRAGNHREADLLEIDDLEEFLEQRTVERRQADEDEQGEEAEEEEDRIEDRAQLAFEDARRHIHREHGDRHAILEDRGVAGDERAPRIGIEILRGRRAVEALERFRRGVRIGLPGPLEIIRAVDLAVVVHIHVVRGIVVRVGVGIDGMGIRDEREAVRMGGIAADDVDEGDVLVGPADLLQLAHRGAPLGLFPVLLVAQLLQVGGVQLQGAGRRDGLHRLAEMAEFDVLRVGAQAERRARGHDGERGDACAAEEELAQRRERARGKGHERGDRGRGGDRLRRGFVDHGLDLLASALPDALEHPAFLRGHLGIAHHAGALLGVVDAGDEIPGDELLEREGELRFLEKQGLAVLEGIAALEAAPERRIVGDHALEGAPAAALAEEFHAEIAQRIVFRGAEHGDEGQDLRPGLEELAVGLGQTGEAVEVPDVRAVLVHLERGDERLEVLVLAEHLLVLLLQILRHPLGDRVERVERVAVRLVDPLLVQDAFA